MASGFSISGLISGLDTEALIQSLLTLRRQPIIRIQDRISDLQNQREALRSLRTDLLDVFNRAQDLTIGGSFAQIAATSSDESVLTSEVIGSGATSGSFEIDVTQLASATIATSDSFVGKLANSSATLDSAGFSTTPTSGFFTINGVQITVDVTSDTIQDVVDRITASSAGVTATFNSGDETITLTNTDGSSADIINLGSGDDTGNFLEIANLTGATQSGTPTTLTSTTNLGVVDPSDTLSTVNFSGGSVSAGNFFINGIEITVGDPSTTTLNDVISAINNSEAGVSASFDTATNTVRVVSDTLGSRSINFTDGSSGFLAAVNLDTATQTVGNDAQFTVNGGPTLTRNTNNVNDVISGVTVNLLSTGTAAVTVDTDFDGIIGDINEFVDAINDAAQNLRSAVGTGGDLSSDQTVRIILNFLRTDIFNRPSGSTGDIESLLDLGISTGGEFTRGQFNPLEVDEGTLRSALADNVDDVRNLFINTSGDGIAEQFEDFLRDITSTTGLLESRASASGTIQDQIDILNDRTESIERRVEIEERRLRLQFINLEIALSNFQSINSFLQQRLNTTNSLF